MALKIGFGRRDITPPSGIYMQGYFFDRYGEGVLDDLAANCIAFSDGEKTAVVFSLDIIGMNQEQGDKVRKYIAEKNNLPYEAVYYACTHTHTGPSVNKIRDHEVDEGYFKWFTMMLSDAAADAVADMSDAKVFTDRGTVDNIAFIRRYKMKSGITQTGPRRGNPDIVGPLGTPDTMLQLVKITREGKDDIVILNFQVHPDVIGGVYYSADYPGFVRRCFEGALPQTKCIYFNGAQGDTNHVDTSADAVYPENKSYDHSRHMALCIIGEAMKLYTYAKPTEGDKVDFIQRTVEIPSNRGTPEELPLAEKYIAAHEAGRESEIPYKGMEYTTYIAGAYRIKRLANGPDSFNLYISAVRFGDIVFSGIPGEPFTDIGRGIKEGSPFGMTLVNCLANGAQGYYPTKSAFDEGGYEAKTSSFKSGVAEILIDESLKMLNELYDR